MNHYAKALDEFPDNVAWRFAPKTTRSKEPTLSDITRELFDRNMEGCLYVAFVRVPGGFPCEDYDTKQVDLYEPEQALEILSAWLKKNGYKLVWES